MSVGPPLTPSDRCARPTPLPGVASGKSTGEGAVPSPRSGPPGTGRVLLVEDHPLLADSLRFCLEAEGHEVAAAPLDSRQALLQAAERLLPDVVLLDVDLGETIGDGATLVGPLNRLGATVIVVSGTTQPGRVGAFIEQGAAGFVPKSRSLDALVIAVADAISERPLMTEDERADLRAELLAARERSGGLDRLTPREAEVLMGLVDGRSVLEIAADAYVSEGTVRSQIRSILTKLDVNSQLAAVALARKAGWPSRG